MRGFLLFLLVVVAGGVVNATSAYAADPRDRAELLQQRPITLQDVLALKGMTPPTDKALKEAQKAKAEFRAEALKDAAMSYGARAGLAYRTWEIRLGLVQRAAYLDRVFDFNRLLIKAPSGLMIEPPIIGEAQDAMQIEADGQIAAVADKVYNINTDAKIAPIARNWRTYLEREWGEVAPPTSLLYPVSKEERDIYSLSSRQGWDEGMKQADEVFQADLDRLTADYNGMVRYRMLLAQNMVSAPYALQVDRGVTGGGREMRVGDRAVKITGPSVLMPDGATWQPANQ